jgi:hypothetical protein
MRSSRNAKQVRSGRSPFSGLQALLSALLLSTFALAAAQAPKPAHKKSSQPARANELTLAGLRPGRSSIASARAKYKAPVNVNAGESSYSWIDRCRGELLAIDVDPRLKIQVIRVEGFPKTECESVASAQWKTGNGLRRGEPTQKVLQLYGPPDSKSPSSKNGQPLELWYYAFDWAGPDVPQVMEVLCTKEQDGKPGQVTEITLAAPSL